MRKRFWLVAALLAAVAVKAAPVNAACVDHQPWDTILQANVDNDGLVDYDGIRAKHGGDLEAYIKTLQSADLSGCTEQEKEAFWINAYNANVVRLVLARPKLVKVSDDFKIFDEKFKAAKIDVSANDIENRILRSDKSKGGPIPGVSVPRFDPRMHFALVCAAIDCPKLLNHAYQGATLQQQLQMEAEAFANNPKHLRLENGKLVLSSIMKWYMQDFDRVGGVAAYLITLTDAKRRPDEKEIDAHLAKDFPKNVDFRYDWTLNSIKNKKK